MTYQVLARKWRPKNFSEMAGQGHVLQTLTHALEQQRLHHAYLFTGTRGVGKTTVARILARCLNCEQGITATPCGECNACREISEGWFIERIEVDAASRTRVEDTRELLENVQYAPARGRYKVYLIDEVHMLSTHSFNALLKTLEEPPPHVKFLLATTDPQKLPITVLSRCLQFHLKNLAPAQIVNYLQSVLAAEQIDFEEDALWQLARAAGGSMRDALTLLDQSISFGAGRVHSAAITSLLGTPDHAMVFALIQALSERNAASLVTTVAAHAENNPDYVRVLEQMLGVFHRLALAQVMPEAVDNSEGDREQVLALASQLAAEDVQLYYQICVQTLQEITQSPDRRISFEMALLRMLAFSPDVFANPGLLGGTESSPANSEKKKPLTTEPRVERVAEPAPEPEIESELEPEPEPEPEVEPEGERQTVQPLEPPIADDTAAARQSFQSPPDDDWYQLVQRSGLSGIAGNILSNCVPEQFGQHDLQLILDVNQSALYTADQATRIAEALSSTLGRAVAVDIRIGELPAESPAERKRREKQAAIDALHHSFNTDPGVLKLIATFDAQVEQNSLQISEPLTQDQRPLQ